jgi:Protein of unknown function (DUF998)
MASSTTPKTSARAPRAAQISLILASIALVSLDLLHMLKPELDPTWHMISEYEIGNFGWLMQLVFFAIAASSTALSISLWPQLKSWLGRIGATFMPIAALGMTVAGLNATDPIGTPAAQMSSHGILHGYGFMIGVPFLTFGITLLTLALRRLPTWSSLRSMLLWFAVLPWLSLVGMVLVFAILLPAHNGTFEPGVIVGIPNRLYIITSLIWLIIAARHSVKLSK